MGVAKLITIFGGSGFVGRYVVQALAKTGARLRVATRDPHLALHVRPLAALGQLDFVRTDLRSEASLARAVEGADAVINLVGILSDSQGGFEAVHVNAAGAIAKAPSALPPVIDQASVCPVSTSVAVAVPTTVPFALFSTTANVAAVTTGASLIGVMATETVAGAEVPMPLLTVNVKLSAPFWFAVGV